MVKPKNPETENEHYANTSQIAAAIGKTTQRVNQLVDEGVLPVVKEGRFNKFNWVKTINAYLSYLESKQENKGNKSLDDEARKLKAEADYKEAKAEQEKLRLAELQGSMHRSEYVEECVLQLALTTRSNLLALPGRLAVDLASMNDAEEISIFIRDEVNRILDDLSEFEYNPETYARMVADREKWDNYGYPENHEFKEFNHTE